jgi:hypothetical protein
LRLAEELAPVVKLVRSVNSLLLIPGADVCERAADYGIAAFDRRQPGWERRWRAGDLTAEVPRRAGWTAWSPGCAPSMFPWSFPTATRSWPTGRGTPSGWRPCSGGRPAYGQRLIDLNLAAERLLAGGPPAAPGDGLLALAICPSGRGHPPYGLASWPPSAARSGFPRRCSTSMWPCIVAPGRSCGGLEEDSFRHWTDWPNGKNCCRTWDAEIDRVVERLLESGRRIIGFSVYSPNRRFTIEVCRV